MVKNIKVKELIASLKTLDQNARVLVSSDEELNTIFNEIAIGDIGDKTYVLCGLSGSEED